LLVHDISTSASPGVSSSEDLFHHLGLRVSVWVVAAVTLLGNLLVVWGRWSTRDDNKVLSVFIRNLAGKLARKLTA